MSKFTAWAYSETGEAYTYIGQAEEADGARRICEERAGARLNWETRDGRWVAFRMNMADPEFMVKDASNDGGALEG